MSKGSGVEELYSDKLNRITFIYIPKSDLKATFAAFVTSFKDSYKSDWQPQNVYGRMDPIGVFKGTQRTISVSFDIPSYDEEDAVNNVIQLQNLIQMTYPVYEDRGRGATSLVANPLVKMKWGNLVGDSRGITELVGYFPSGVDYSPDFEGGTFYINGKLVPKLHKLDITFTVLHTHELGFELNIIPELNIRYNFDISTNESPGTILNYNELKKQESNGVKINPIGPGPFSFEGDGQTPISDNLQKITETSKVKILSSEYSKDKYNNIVKYRFPVTFPYSIKGKK